MFMKEGEKDIDLKLCGEVAGFCDEKSGDDYQLEDEDEMRDEL